MIRLRLRGRKEGTYDEMKTRRKRRKIIKEKDKGERK